MAHRKSRRWTIEWHGVAPAGVQFTRGIVVASVLAVFGSVEAPIGSAAAADAQASGASTTLNGIGAAVSVSGNPQNGASRAESLYCGVCHGPSGRSETPEWPSLAGQGASYLEQQLRLFRSGERINLEMAPIAASLTDADIADLSAYYAEQSPRSPGSASTSTASASELYRKGDVARSIQPCASCHGPEGEGDAKTMAPALRWQQATYIRNQIEAYARRSRYRSAVPPGLDPAGIQAMYDVSMRLSEDEVQQLALYLQSLRGVGR